MIKKPFSRQLTAIGLLAILNPVTQAEGEPSQLFEPAEQDAKGRFINLDKEHSKASIRVTAPFFMRRVASSLFSHAGAPKRIANDGAYLRENATHSDPTATWIGHATLLVQMEHVTFLTDPIWSNTPSPVPFFGPNRHVKPGLAIKDLPPIDFVVISHNHYDHLDLPTLRKLAKRNAETIFFVPLGNGKLLRDNGIQQVQEMDWGDSINYKTATIHCLPTQHWSKRSLTDTRKALWSSWAVTGSERRFFFAGDTAYYSGFKQIGEKLGPFDLVAVPIGAYDPTAMMKASHMNPEEAVQAALDLQAENAVAVHFGTFNLSDEPLAEPPLRFKAAAENTVLADRRSWVMDIGETRKF